MPLTKSTFGVTLLTAVLHLASFGCGLAFWLTLAEEFPVRQTRWDLPASTTSILYLADHPGRVVVLFAVAIVIDIVVIVRLSYSANRSLQDAWTGLVAVLAMLTVSTIAVAVFAPYQAFHSADFEHDRASQSAIRREEVLLDGTWELLAREEAGVKESVSQDILSQLVFDAQEHRATWTLGTQIFGKEEISPYLWHVDIAPPKRLRFFAFHLDTPELGYYREILYECDEVQLELCIAPHDTPAQRLPVTFNTDANENLILVYRRVDRGGSVSQ